MKLSKAPIDTILQGDSLEILKNFPDKSVDLVFADPPYNLQLQNELFRPNMTQVEAVTDAWDKFGSFAEYDCFSHTWLQECKRILKDNGTLWVIGTYHNIYRIGTIMQDLGYWFLNDIVWVKTNPMPNFRGVRFTNAHETLIWAATSKKSRYTFNHHAMKNFNDDLQMRSDWWMPICSGKERIRENGKRAHATQKPQSLLYRILLSSTNPGDLVLDPFFGSGTTGAVAKRLHRHWVGIESRDDYIDVATRRIAAVRADPFDDSTYDASGGRQRPPRVPMGTLLEQGWLQPGQQLYFKCNLNLAARLRADGKISYESTMGSIHSIGSQLSNGSPCNGWDHWYYQDEEGVLHNLDTLRQRWLVESQSTANELEAGNSADEGDELE